MHMNMHYTVWIATNLLNDETFGRTNARFRNIVFTIGTIFPPNHFRESKQIKLQSLILLVAFKA